MPKIVGVPEVAQRPCLFQDSGMLVFPWFSVGHRMQSVWGSICLLAVFGLKRVCHILIAVLRGTEGRNYLVALTASFPVPFGRESFSPRTGKN